MAEMEDKTSNDVTETETEETENTETEAYSPKDEYTYEEVVAMEARLRKAEKALVERKKADKANKQKAEGESTSPEALSTFITKQDLALEKFLDKNPEMEDYKEDIKKHLSKGLSLAEAKLLIDNSPAIVNRKKISSTNISHSEGTGSINSEYSKAELGKLSDIEYERIIPLIKSGKVRLT